MNQIIIINFEETTVKELIKKLENLPSDMLVKRLDPSSHHALLEPFIYTQVVDLNGQIDFNASRTYLDKEVLII